MIITTSFFKSVRVDVSVQPSFTRAAHSMSSTRGIPAANNPVRIENCLKTLRLYAISGDKNTWVFR